MFNVKVLTPRAVELIDEPRGRVLGTVTKEQGVWITGFATQIDCPTYLQPNELTTLHEIVQYLQSKQDHTLDDLKEKLE